MTTRLAARAAVAPTKFEGTLWLWVRVLITRAKGAYIGRRFWQIAAKPSLHEANGVGAFFGLAVI